jgi:hypothetical protein
MKASSVYMRSYTKTMMTVLGANLCYNYANGGERVRVYLFGKLWQGPVDESVLVVEYTVPHGKMFAVVLGRLDPSCQLFVMQDAIVDYTHLGFAQGQHFSIAGADLSFLTMLLRENGDWILNDALADMFGDAAWRVVAHVPEQRTTAMQTLKEYAETIIM